VEHPRPLAPRPPRLAQGQTAPGLDRLCLNGIRLVIRQGLRWQSLPSELGWGSGSTCWRRFAEWTAAGVWEQGHVALVTALGDRGLLHLERAIVDSLSVRTVRGGAHGADSTMTGSASAALKKAGVT
jgi:transposase